MASDDATSSSERSLSSGSTCSDESSNVIDRSMAKAPVSRIQRAWSWPMDRWQLRDVPPFPALRLPSERYKTSAKRLGLYMCCIIGFAVYVTVGLRRYATAPEPFILGGWSKACPATWLYSGSPTMILLGYEPGYDEIRAPWSVLNQAKRNHTKCWHGDRNVMHQGNKLNLTFPPQDSWSFGDINTKILERGERAFRVLTSDRATPQSREDDLPQCGVYCQKCQFSTAAKALPKAALNPFLDPTASHPRSIEELTLAIALVL